MFRIYGMVSLLLLVVFFGYSDAADELTYSAAVVEFSPTVTGDTVPVRVTARVKKIVDQINLDAHKSVDIIVFPEYSLSEAIVQSLPNPNDRTVLCSNASHANNILQTISCAAQNAKTYVVVNALTQQDCKAEQLSTDDTRQCADNNLNVYSTNIVFDRNGAVISTYRKFNTFGENDLNSTLVPDVSMFDTDFGVKFGHLAGNDILHEHPSASLIKFGVKNFVYPTKWVSSLPFLTSIQSQQNWAHAQNVNLLAAGFSEPNEGHTGSGIYSGEQGALVSMFSSTPLDVGLTSSITKTPATNALPARSMPVTPAKVKLGRDQQLDSYTIVKLNVTETSSQTKLCHGTDFCCDFTYWLEDLGASANSITYEYVAAVFNGTTTLGGSTKPENVVSCSVFTCQNATNISSCGQFDNTVTRNRYHFKALNIIGEFCHNHTLIMPNSLANVLIPLPVMNFHFNISDTVMEQYKTVNMSLVKFENHLLTFGIWGRDFRYSSSAPYLIASWMLILVTIAGIFI